MQSKENPNYGKATDLGAQKWWTKVEISHDWRGHIQSYVADNPKVIEGTFSPFLNAGQVLPPTITSTLLHRFSSKEGYEVYPDALNFIKQTIRQRNAFDDEASNDSYGRRVIVGVITNSDDRVPDILKSLDFIVSPLRFPPNKTVPAATEADIAFVVMSYDVGHEKPDRRIFDAALTVFGQVVSKNTVNLGDWKRVYVGDEVDKDVVAAIDAGWEAIHIDRSELSSSATSRDNDARPRRIAWMKTADGKAYPRIRNFEDLWNVV